MGKSLLLPLASKSFSSLRVTPMSPNVVPIVAEQENHSVTETVTTEPRDACSLQYAPSAAKTQKYLLNPEKTDQFTAVNATVKSERDRATRN